VCTCLGPAVIVSRFGKVPICAEPQQLEVSIDGQRVQVFTLAGVAAPPPPPSSEPVAAADLPADDTVEPSASARRVCQTCVYWPSSGRHGRLRAFLLLVMLMRSARKCQSVRK